MKEILIDGITYTPKDKAVILDLQKGEQYCMVRTYSAGVWCGYIDPDKTINKKNRIREAKRIHYWDGAASLSELAMRGTSDPDNCRIPMAVDFIALEEIIETIVMQQEAIDTINKVPEWTAH